jgi:hypothetical protein
VAWSWLAPLLLPWPEVFCAYEGAANAKADSIARAITDLVMVFLQKKLQKWEAP